MKLVTAIIQPNKLDEVREALWAAEITRITVDRCAGRAGHGESDLHRGQSLAGDLIPRVRIEIACNDAFVDIAIRAILGAARHGDGEPGDGKIFVTPLERCIRIRTGEEGPEAI